MTPLDAMPINHDDALQLALIKQDESNLARCYLELRMQMERDAAMQSLTDVQQEMEKQEPVAWRWRESIWFDWTTDWTHHDRAKAMGCPIEYAYTPPPPSAV